MQNKRCGNELKPHNNLIFQKDSNSIKCKFAVFLCAESSNEFGSEIYFFVC